MAKNKNEAPVSLDKLSHDELLVEAQAMRSELEKVNTELKSHLKTIDEKDLIIDDLNTKISTLQEEKKTGAKAIIINKSSKKKYEIRHGVKHEGKVYSIDDIKGNDKLQDALIEMGSGAMKELTK